MRLGIMSFAHLHAEGYIHNIRRIPGVEMVGFSDTDAERGQHFADAYGARWFKRHEDMLAEGLDGVVICSENANHRELVEMAAEAKVQILCEKPIEVTLEDAQAMKAACDRHSVNFMTAFPARFMLPVRETKQRLERGDLGQIYAVNGINHSEIPRAHRAWFAQKALAGGGAVMDHTVHLVDMLRWFFGCEIVEVYAEVDDTLYKGEVDVDTSGMVMLTFANGVFASVDCSWSRPTTYPRWGDLKFEIIGSNGFTVVDSLAQYHTLYSQSGGRNPAWLNWGSDPNQAMMNEFVASIREKRAASVTWNDGYQALRVALACYESAAAGQPVRLS